MSAAPSSNSSHTKPSLSLEGTTALNQSAILENKPDGSQPLEDSWDADPRNPRNWSFRQKWTSVAVVSMYTFVSPLSSSMLAPGLPEIAEKYSIENVTILSMTLSIFLLTFAIGPLVLAPLSVLHIGNIFLVAFNLGCAFAPNTGSLLGFRLLAGLAGSAPIACGGGCIRMCPFPYGEHGDLFSERDRASAMAIYTLGPLIGPPSVFTVFEGFIAQIVGVKYIFIAIAGSCAFAGISGIPLLRETYGPVIRLRIAAQLGDSEKLTGHHGDLVPGRDDKLHYIWVNLSRPFIILFRSSICFVLSLYMSFMYGIYYLLFATFANLFKETYGFGPGIGGLAYLGLGFGFFLSTFFGAGFADQVYHYLAEKNQGKGTPEMRIPALIFGSFFVPIGLFWYGCLPITLYLVDTFSYAASALAAATVSSTFFRSLLGFAFPLFGQQMFDTLGLGGGTSLLGGLAIILGIPFPIYIYYYGEAIRMKSPLSVR
ncbi:multidrug resistance protein 4 [Mycena leptocephala]|nr:multidrug resistance protein 4 [Mycena leptocephala]